MKQQTFPSSAEQLQARRPATLHQTPVLLWRGSRASQAYRMSAWTNYRL